MDAFRVRDSLVGDYGRYVRGFVQIRQLRNSLTNAVAEAFEMPSIEFGFYKDHANRDRYTMSPSAQEQVYLSWCD
jgi:hypothetical protein